jgi:hypothetical protein
MEGEIQNKEVLVRGKEVFVGVDVHKESWHVTARTEGEENIISTLFSGNIKLVNSRKDGKASHSQILWKNLQALLHSLPWPLSDNTSYLWLSMFLL